jgi:hypothetical protein
MRGLPLLQETKRAPYLGNLADTPGLARLLFPKASPAAVPVLLMLMQRPPTFVTHARNSPKTAKQLSMKALFLGFSLPSYYYFFNSYMYYV